jgi:hypothetical protein
MVDLLQFQRGPDQIAHYAHAQEQEHGQHPQQQTTITFPVITM